MKKEITVSIPDIGDFENIPVIEILVKPGEMVKKEDSILVLESDKATMEVPSPEEGIVTRIILSPDDTVSKGDAILVLESQTSNTTEVNTSKNRNSPEKNKRPLSPNKIENDENQVDQSKCDIHADVVILGSGPGGYTAAFRAADLGKNVLIIERHKKLGGVCLNVGCIPSKALLHTAKVITEAQDISKNGIVFSSPKIDMDKLRKWKNQTVSRLTKGLSLLAEKRNVQLLTGVGRFTGKNTLSVETSSGEKTVSFDYAIIAAGSSPKKVPGFSFEDPRIMDSTDALEITEIPDKLLIIGGGIIGLEMASIYHGLGSKITIAELTDRLIPEADRDLIRPLQGIIESRYDSIRMVTKITDIKLTRENVAVTLMNSNNKTIENFDKVLVSIGRSPNGKNIGAANAGIEVQNDGFISVNKQMRTNVPNIFAIGDIVGQPMLAHKASHEGKLCAEIIAGNGKAEFDALTIPSVAYTDPEVAWVGITENYARQNKIAIKKSVFPWTASGRAQATSRTEGLTKLIFDKKTRKLIGAGIVGINAGELISETALAIEMGADSEDIGLTIHPHPTLSETVLFSAEIAEESITDLYLGKK